MHVPVWCCGVLALLLPTNSAQCVCNRSLDLEAFKEQLENYSEILDLAVQTAHNETVKELRDLLSHAEQNRAVLDENLRPLSARVEGMIARSMKNHIKTRTQLMAVTTSLQQEVRTGISEFKNQLKSLRNDVLFLTEALRVSFLAKLVDKTYTPRHVDGKECSSTAWSKLPLTTLGNTVYYFSRESLDWYSAGNFCLSHGMDLVAVETKQENDLINQHRVEVLKSNSDYWSGGISVHEDGSFTWASTGHNLTFSDWQGGSYDRAGAPGKCLLMYSHGTPKYWLVAPCTNSYLFVCELTVGN